MLSASPPRKVSPSPGHVSFPVPSPLLWNFPQKKKRSDRSCFFRNVSVEVFLLRELYVSYTVFFFFTFAVSFFSLIPCPFFFFREQINRDRSFLQVSCLALCSARFPFVNLAGHCLDSDGCSPERRCSSRTFRYGYLVTT